MTYKRIDELPFSCQVEISDMLLGAHLGKGWYRNVYVWELDSTKVIKIETSSGRSFSNVSEWQIWDEVSTTDHPLRKWLAPCFHISPGGAAMIQARTQPIDKLPDEIPNLLADTKIDNWGLYNDRPVMHDYGNHALYTNALKKFRMVKRKITE